MALSLLGSIRDLVSAIFRADGQDITLQPNSTTAYTASRTVELPLGDTDHVLVSATSVATLTGKNIGGNDNTIYDLAIESFGEAAEHAGKIPIYTDEGELLPATVQGDVTISPTGGSQIGAGKVTDTMIVGVSGSKVTPAFVAQNISTTGTLDVGKTVVSASVGALEYVSTIRSDTPNHRNVLKLESNAVTGTTNDLITAVIDADGTPSTVFSVRQDGKLTAGATTVPSLTLGSGSPLTVYVTDGVWTPSPTSTGGGAASIGTALGTYTKIGDIVMANFELAFSRGTMLDGTFYINNLPFPAKAMTAGNLGILGLGGGAVPAGQIMVRTNESFPSRLSFRQTASSGAATNTTVYTFGTGTIYIYGSVTYIAVT